MPGLTPIRFTAAVALTPCLSETTPFLFLNNNTPPQL